MGQPSNFVHLISLGIIFFFIFILDDRWTFTRERQVTLSKVVKSEQETVIIFE